MADRRDKSKPSIPMGYKLAEGFKDRAAARRERERAEKGQKDADIKALEELLREGTITEDVFKEQRAAIERGAGQGNVTLMGVKKKTIDDEFEELEGIRGEKRKKLDGEWETSASKHKPRTPNEILAAMRKAYKEGAVTTPKASSPPKTNEVEKEKEVASPQPAPKPRTRNEILAEMKAIRQRKAQPSTVPVPKKPQSLKKGPVFGADAEVLRAQVPKVLDINDDIFADIGSYDNPFAEKEDSSDEYNAKDHDIAATKPSAIEAEASRAEIPGKRSAGGYFRENVDSVLQRPDAAKERELLKALAEKAKAKEAENMADEEGQARSSRKLAEWQEQAARDRDDVEYGYGEDSDEDEQRPGKRKRKR